jgi:Protein of unknown function (DUF3617)
MGLWESTTTQTTKTTGTIPQRMAQEMRQKGMPPDSSFQRKEHACMTATVWEAIERQGTAWLQQIPSDCTVTKSTDRRDLKAVTMNCKMQTGMTMTIDSFSSIDKPTEIHGSLHMTAAVLDNPSAVGKTTSITETRGRFLSPDCGSVVPGRNVPAN